MKNFIIIILVLLSLGIGFGPTLVGRFTRDTILENGVSGKAKVIGVTDTGSRYNYDPVVTVLISIATPDGEMTAEITQPLSAVRLMQVQPGSEIDVKYDPKAPSRAAIVFDKKIIPPNNKIMQQDSNFLIFSAEYLNLNPLKVRMEEEGTFTQIPKLKIKLLDVLNDGRCPSSVNCAQSGQATILVEASYDGIVEKKELHIWGGHPEMLTPPYESGKPSVGNVLSIGQHKVFLAALIPSPVTFKDAIKKADYEAVFLADTVERLELRKEIVKVAQDELKKHLPDYERYLPVGITPDGVDTSATYTVTLDIPLGPTDQTVFVEVGYTDGQWKAVSFYKGAA